MHTKCDERMDGRTGVKQYAPPTNSRRGINILSNQTTALRGYLALYKNIEQSDNSSREVLCIQILSNQTTALRRYMYLALYKNIEQSDNSSQEVLGFV